MPVEERGLSSGPTQHVARDAEIGQPSNSGKCSEAADGVTRESEGSAGLSLLCAVRQDLPRRHPGARLRPVPLESGRGGGGRSGLRGGRSVRRGAVARRTGACTQAGDVPTGTDQTSVHPEGQWQAQATGHLDPARSGGHDSSDAGARSDLRSRPSPRAVRLPAGQKRPAGGSRGGGHAVPRSPGSGGRRPRGLLRQHPARRVTEIGGAPSG